MKKLLATITATALLTTILTVKANESDAMVEMIVSMMKKSGEIRDLSTCLGITEEKFINAYTDTIKLCFPKDALQGDCMDEMVPEIFGLPQSKFEACTSDDSEYAQAESDIDLSTLSDDERNALLDQQRTEAMANMEEMAAFMKKASEGTEGKITLPVYSPSSLTSHYINGMESSSGNKTLPVATFTTTDSVDEVIEFYKKSLPNFEIGNSGEIYYMMEKLPGNLSQLSHDLENLPLYFVPHIETYSLKMSGEETTLIVISYEPS
ncbi:hypothetical protein [Colwellia asteriadis]